MNSIHEDKMAKLREPFHSLARSRIVKVLTEDSCSAFDLCFADLELGVDTTDPASQRDCCQTFYDSLRILNEVGLEDLLINNIECIYMEGCVMIFLWKTDPGRTVRETMSGVRGQFGDCELEHHRPAYYPGEPTAPSVLNDTGWVLLERATE